MLNAGKVRAVVRKRKPQSQILKWTKIVFMFGLVHQMLQRLLIVVALLSRKLGEDEEGVSFEIDRSAFRGAPYAFKVLK